MRFQVYSARVVLEVTESRPLLIKTWEIPGWARLDTTVYRIVVLISKALLEACEMILGI